MHTRFPKRRGAMLVLVALVVVILLVGAVFSVDIAYMHMVRAELQAATDAAARAGSETLARTQDLAAARQAAIQTAAANRVAGVGLNITQSDIQVGSVQPKGNTGELEFLPNQPPFIAMQVMGRREDASANGAVRLFFARVFSTLQFEPVRSATAAANVRDVALVLDISGSMAEKTSSGTRLSALRDAVNLFISEVQSSCPRTMLSLTSYSTNPKKEADLTADFDSIRDKVSQFSANGMTAIGNALTMGSDSLVNDPLARKFAAKTIVLMTDGNHNTGPSPTQTLATPVARGQQIHTITFSSGANQKLMRDVAQATYGGRHIHADQAADLAQAFREIARSLSVVLVQ